MKEKTMRLILSGFLAFVFLVSCNAQQHGPVTKKQNNNNTLLWQVSGKGLAKPSYLFGTFHLMCKDDIHFSEQLKSAIKNSSEMYMEMDMDDPSILMSGFLYLNMKNGKTLKDLYSATEYNRVEKYFSDTLHTPLSLLQNAKPYFLVALLYPKMLHCSSPTGVEEELVKLAKENKKEIKGLETMQFQASVFDSIPYEWQAKELLKNIDSSQQYKNEFDSMLVVYKDQHLDEIGKLFSKSEFGSEAFEDLLITKRNINWVTQLKNIMRNESVVVAVGAGHLVGNNGLISLLRKEGYSVDPLENK
jgi:uncharacterized protein YbaP (TraB family)